MKTKVHNYLLQLQWRNERFRKFAFWTLHHPLLWKLCFGWGQETEANRG